MRLFAEDVQEKIDQVPEVTDADVSVLRRDLAALVIEASAPPSPTATSRDPG